MLAVLFSFYGRQSQHMLWITRSASHSHKPEILKWGKEERESSVQPTPEGTRRKKKYENRRANLTLFFDQEGFKKSTHKDLACNDCHDAHNIRPVKEPESWVNPTNPRCVTHEPGMANREPHGRGDETRESPGV